MKRFADYINNKYISLAGLDEEVVEKLSNLDGAMINECDCGCCRCGDGCCEPYALPGDATACTNNTCGVPTPAPVPVDPAVLYKEKFYGMPKVYDLLDAHTTLDYRCRFISEYQRSMKEPILFYDCDVVGYSDSTKLRDDVLTLCDDFELLWPVMLIKNDGTIQLFAAKKFGSNGEECSIKSSLVDAAAILTKLEKRKEIEWAQVLDVSIDNLDDLYDFLFTVTFKKDKYDEEITAKREKQMKDNLKAMTVSPKISFAK